MAIIKYTGEEALGRVADYVNKKLTFASTMPTSPDTNTIILYVGADTSAYKQGGIYQFDGTDWNLINLVRAIELTQTEYNALPSAAKLNGTIYFVTDAPSGGGGDIVEGYYNDSDGKFYEESTYTTEIAGASDTIYMTLDTNTLYRYDIVRTAFIQIAGGGGGAAIIYVNSLPTTDIQNVIYGTFTYINYSDKIDTDFLDNNPIFEKTVDGDNYTYTAVSDVQLEASDDDVTYLDFASLSYDNTSGDWTLAFADGSDITLATADMFYYRKKIRSFYAGNAVEQITIPFASGGGEGGSGLLPGEGVHITNNMISLDPATNATLGGIVVDDNTIKVDGAGVISGHYQGGYGIKVDGNEISAKTFIGTQADQNTLTPTQQAAYDTVSITDDNSALNNTPGHVVLDSTGNALPQRTNLEFEGAVATDDSTNDITKITVTPYTAGDKIDITNNEVSCDETVKGTFIGTQSQQNSLSATDKAKYEVVNLTDDVASGGQVVVDTIQDGNFNAVTSNAVYDAISDVNNKIIYRIKTYTSDSSTARITVDGINGYIPIAILPTSAYCTSMRYDGRTAVLVDGGLVPLNNYTTECLVVYMKV